MLKVKYEKMADSIFSILFSIELTGPCRGETKAKLKTVRLNRPIPGS
jgi:hypothetical protein